ncbi:hypothetical protein CLV33_107121 [Jejuia pallidilutea]|uniref:Uncharacterized protein n=1 Tax=Jejuia pallidilutea TaxID=504487 RepID=A0A362X7H3_9FLAO|nr:hypothetical protein CLV33_107121 [Jejuia pallidilutea]
MSVNFKITKTKSQNLHLTNLVDGFKFSKWNFSFYRTHLNFLCLTENEMSA